MARQRVACRNCGRWYQTDGSNDGKPWGLITVSMNVPKLLSRNSKPYIFLGMFCDLACLQEYMPGLVEKEDEFLEAFNPTEMQEKGSNGQAAE